MSKSVRLKSSRLSTARLYLMIAAGALIAPIAAITPAAAQVTEVPPVAGDYETISGSATVTAIDPATRMVTLKLADGTSVAVKAGDEVKNFAQIKVGDTVTATYAQSVRFELRKPGSKMPSFMAADAAGAAKPGAKPAGGVMRATALTATIVSVDTAANTVDVVPQGGGAIHTFHVREPSRQAMLKDVKPGQLLTMIYTEAFALSVQPSKT